MVSITGGGNTIQPFREPENFELIFYDQVDKIELIDYTLVTIKNNENFGMVIALECMFKLEDCNTMLDLWRAQETVDYEDDNGLSWSGRVIVMKRIKKDKNFPNYVYMTFELWSTDGTTGG